MIKPGNLKPFFPFAELPPEYVIIVASFTNRVDVGHGEVLLESNSEDPNDYFLFDGKLASQDVYGAITMIGSGSAEAARPLPQLRRVRIASSGKVLRRSLAYLKRLFGAFEPKRRRK